MYLIKALYILVGTVSNNMSWLEAATGWVKTSLSNKVVTKKQYVCAYQFIKFHAMAK